MKNIPIFGGIIIGNGELSAVQSINSLIPEMYAKGFIGKGLVRVIKPIKNLFFSQWDQLQNCCPGGYDSLDFCDFTQFITINDLGNVTSKNSTSLCGNLIANLIMRPWDLGRIALVQGMMNIYQDCYMQQQHNGYFRDFKTTVTLAYLERNDNYDPYSTDSQGGYPCWANQATNLYLK